MHLINDALQTLTAAMTSEQLGEKHSAAIEKELKQLDEPTKPRSQVLGHENRAVKIEQLVSELSRHREAILKGQNENFAALIKDLLDKKTSTEPRKIEEVQPPLSRLSQQDDARDKEHKLVIPEIKSLKQLDHEARNTAMDTIDAVLEKTKALKAQIRMLGQHFGQVPIEGGARNKKIADQAKFLQEKGKELQAQLAPFKRHSNKYIRKNARYVEEQLNFAIDQIAQIVEETQRNGRLIDGLGLETKLSYEKPFSVEEGANIIADHEISLTWKDVPETENDQDRVLLSKLSLDPIDQVSDTRSDAGTDVEKNSESFEGGESQRESNPSSLASNSPMSFSSRSS